MMSRILVAFLLATLFALTSAQTGCGPANCYPGSCGDARPLVDFVFAIDTSASMVNAITGVQQGCVNFVNKITSTNPTVNTYNLNAYFSLVVFSAPNTDPTLSVQNTGNANSFISVINTLTPNSLVGWRETGLETMRCIANKCNTDNMNINYRANSKRVLLFFTDEDSDPANHAANSYESVTQNDVWCPTTATFPAGTFPAGVTFPYTSTPTDYSICTYDYTEAIKAADWTSQWQKEIIDTANILISQSWSVYMLLNNIDNTCRTCLNFVQYGNPTLVVQNSDYTGWSLSGTLAKLTASYSANSLQVQLLKANITAKSFYVYNAADPNFVNNFLNNIAGDINTCNTCLQYLCSTSNPSQCAPPVSICDCAGSLAVNGVFQHTTDINGVCCLTSQIDCAGVCNGGHSYDPHCNVCTAGGVSPSTCVQDCANQYYLNTIPNTAYLPITLPTNFSPAGYVIAQGNGDLLSLAISKGWTTTDAINNAQTSGRFQGRYYCTLDYTAFSASLTSSNLASCSGTACDTTFFTDIKTSSLVSAAKCKAGTLGKFPPDLVDACGQCVTDPNNPPQCVTGCDGRLYGAGTTPKIYDKCGVCGGNNAVDVCGVCANLGSNGTEVDPCGNCPPGTPKASTNYTLGHDNCGNPLCKPHTCSYLCNNQTYSGGSPAPYGYDKCGDCVAYNSATGTYANAAGCAQQCDGTWYNPTPLPYALPQPTPKVYDNCGHCIAANAADPFTCVQDCHGVYGGTATIDACGQCVGDNVASLSCYTDCAGAHYLSNTTAPHTVNSCGVCNLASVGSAPYLDKCGQCTNAIGYSSSSCLQDCSGNYYTPNNNQPHAVVDLCGACIPANNLSTYNYELNACGLCIPGGSANTTFWTLGQSIDPVTGVACPCNTVLRFCAFYGKSICTDCPNPYDACGRFWNDTYYNKYNDCGDCCNSPTCPSAKDLCGTCHGNITSQAILQSQTCGLCPGTPYTIDCHGICFGNSTYDCSGVCGGHCTSCTSSGTCQATCGNGIVEAGEACDDGGNNGKDGICSATCTAIAGQDTGAIVGGVIGAVAAVAVLALLAFFLYKYAVKHGLMGFGNAKADMGSANVNPMYQQQTRVASNPLYQNV